MRAPLTPSPVAEYRHENDTYEQADCYKRNPEPRYYLLLKANLNVSQTGEGPEMTLWGTDALQAWWPRVARH